MGHAWRKQHPAELPAVACFRIVPTRNLRLLLPALGPHAVLTRSGSRRRLNSRRHHVAPLLPLPTPSADLLTSRTARRRAWRFPFVSLPRSHVALLLQAP